MKRWSTLYDRCQDPDCRTPQTPHKGHGLCRNCVWRRKYHANPTFRAQVKQTVKRAYLRDADKVAKRVQEWRVGHREQCHGYQAEYRKKVKDSTQRNPSYPWRIGTTVYMRCLSLTGVICGQVKKLDGERVVDIRLDEGSTAEEVPLTALKALGFSIEDARRVA